MKYINLKNMAEEASISSNTVLCLGNFDGVHLGHRQLVNSVLIQYKSLKEKYSSLCSGVWFFDSNSYKFTDEIYSINEKLGVFASLGLDYAIIADFEEMKSLSPHEFVDDVLKNKCGCIYAVCGENFRFGAKASGNSDTLTELMDNHCTVVPLLTVDANNEESSVVVSSTYIRSLLNQGNISQANHLLSSNYSITEKVIHGKALGRTLGIPTINQLPTTKKLILKNGIYSTICTLDGERYMGVTNIGTRPTVDNDGIKNIETHLINFNGDCYGKFVKIEFISLIRDEKKFDSVGDLKSQIELDIKATIQTLNNK